MQSADAFFGSSPFDPLMGRKRHREMPEFDVTPMVDLVFMMNIYFLVTFVTVAMAQVNLPEASHCAALDADTAVTFTLLGSADGKSVTVFLGDGTKGEALTDSHDQDDRVKEAVTKGVAAGKSAVLLKAEKKVRLSQLFRIVTAAAVEGVKLHVAVLEKDQER